jgi:GMP synthase-like glutamine amidotransferase
MASQLPAAALKAKGGKKTEQEVSTYTIQFKALGAPGRRVVELRGACKVHGTSRAELQKDFLIVFDGGECYFDAIWDATQRKFKHLRFNGVA